MKVLIDGDIICYRAGFACENEDLAIALWQTDEMIKRILLETDASDSQVFLTGSDNFRYKINPNYKANRKDAKRPKWLPNIREHLVTKWGASVTDAVEADDAMGIEQTRIRKETGVIIEELSCIASIDKDMKTIPGLHYNFVKGEWTQMSEVEAKQFLYFQLLMGDGADNIFGFDGKARPKVPKFLESMVAELYTLTEEKDMYDFCLDLYQMNGQGKEQMHINAHCLYIWHKEDDEWKPPT